jgi:DNA-binding PadR family transcriptional regulator
VTNAELAILSLVVEQPRHGYDIDQVIVERNMRDWTDVGFSSIYYLLRKLEGAGLVTSQQEPAPGRGPSRRVYSATKAGVTRMHEAAVRALAGPARQPTNFQLGLAALPGLDSDEVAAAMASHEADLVAQLETLRRRSEGELPFHVTAMFDLAVSQVEAELAWIRRFAVGFNDYRTTERGAR